MKVDEKQIAKTHALLCHAIDKVDVCIQEWGEKSLPFTTELELLQIQSTLRKMKEAVENKQDIPNPRMGRYLIDTWPLNNDLLDIILKAEQGYKKLLDRRML